MQVNDLDSGGRRRQEFGCWQGVFLAATDGATPWWKENHGRSREMIEPLVTKRRNSGREQGRAGVRASWHACAGRHWVPARHMLG